MFGCFYGMVNFRAKVVFLSKNRTMKSGDIRTAIIILSALFYAGCSNQPQWQHDKGRAHGTFYSIIYQSPINLKNEIEAVMKSVDNSMSTFKPESTISRLNKGETDVELDSLFITVFDKAKEVWRNTEGAFDMTVAPLVNAWGFGYAPESNVSAGEIDSLLTIVGFEKVERAGNRLVVKKAGIKLDASAIAKGYSVDLVSQFLESKGIENYMVEIGGEVRVKGKNPKNSPWRIGIESPTESAAVSPDRDLQMIILIENGAIATSGNYRQFYYKDGKKFAHTIDPRTGYPVQHNLLSVSVYAPDCMTADAYATAFMVLGLEKSILIVNSIDSLEACFIYSLNDSLYHVEMTNGFKHLVASN